MIIKQHFVLIGLILSILPGLHAQSGSIIESGSGYIVGENILHPNGLIFDQVLMDGQTVKLRAKPGNITRISFMDTNQDIVQVEFFGAGTFTVTLDPDTYLPPAPPTRYNQDVEYVTGIPSILVEGADNFTFLSIFTVGRVNAVNQALFPEGIKYDAQADVKLVEVINSSGFGGMQMANTEFSGSTGKVGIDAKDVPIAVRLIVGDIDASDSAVPYLLFGEGSFTVSAPNTGLIITGGDLYQSNGAKIVAISQADNLISQENVRSDGRQIEAKQIAGVFDFVDLLVEEETPEDTIDDNLIPQVPFAPNNLNGKTYDITFSGYGMRFAFGPLNTPGTFTQSGDINSIITIGGLAVIPIMHGKFTTKIRTTFPNEIQATLTGKTIVGKSADTEFSFGTIEDIALNTGIPFRKTFKLTFNYSGLRKGTCSMIVIWTDGFIQSDNGSFVEVR